ncbi:hypothetical protein LR48_Vigan294s000400 [Vigna angularis]|uniref:Putative plant transposon protein domain-containing protein n=1 Tax=Phaseolus angularis TaxID=3914 RepID=A0A0L9T7M3_PHAAN|nr:hypothetical protein LR48_Vigan294s000400 [Vigna angularis]
MLFFSCFPNNPKLEHLTIPYKIFYLTQGIVVLQDREERVVVDVFKDEMQAKEEEASYKAAFRDAPMTSRKDENLEVSGNHCLLFQVPKEEEIGRGEKIPSDWKKRRLQLGTPIGDYPAENYLGYVRGHAIRYDPDSINNFLDTVWAGEQCQFALCMEEGVDFEDVERVLCIPGGHFQRNRSGSVVNIRRTDLNPLAKYWMAFSHANIQPCSHVSDITLSRALFIYCAIRNLNVNIGQVIADEISVCANTSNNKAPLGHPSLITHLCKIAGVDTSVPSFERPRKAIDEAYYRQYCGGEEAAQLVPPHRARRERGPAQSQTSAETHEAEPFQMRDMYMSLIGAQLQSIHRGQVATAEMIVGMYDTPPAHRWTMDEFHNVVAWPEEPMQGGGAGAAEASAREMEEDEADDDDAFELAKFIRLAH